MNSRILHIVGRLPKVGRILGASRALSVLPLLPQSLVTARKFIRRQQVLAIAKIRLRVDLRALHRHCLYGDLAPPPLPILVSVLLVQMSPSEQQIDELEDRVPAHVDSKQVLERIEHYDEDHDDLDEEGDAEHE